MKNKVQLITYVDRLSKYTGRTGIKKLNELLLGPLCGLFPGGVHVLPFYFPIDGADAGYDPIDHTLVDPQIGTWEDIQQLGKDFDLMGDIIVNHMSSGSNEFQDVITKGKSSEYYDLFMKFSDVFPSGANSDELLNIYRPRPGLPFTVKLFENGDKDIFWTTFTSEQIDINVEHEEGKKYLDRILKLFHENGLKSIRLDAAGYAIKKQGESCFMMPETYAFIDEFTEKANALGMDVLVEIHSYYKDQIEIASKVDYVYDFALPPLILHTIFTGSTEGLKKWLSVSPRNCVTVLDTHDGIGVIDIGPKGGKPGLIPDEQVDELVDEIHKRSGGESRKATGEAASNLDLYQVNCTYYSALGQNDSDYILARAIQFFCPGIPQVYYAGLLAGENDLELLEKTGVGRDINRHYYDEQEVLSALEKPVVRDLVTLIRLRNLHEAFNGEFSVSGDHEKTIRLKWENEGHLAMLTADFGENLFEVSYTEEGGLSNLSLQSF